MFFLLFGCASHFVVRLNALAVLPLTFRLHAVDINGHTGAVLLAVAPMATVGTSIRPHEHAFAVLHVLLVLPLKEASRSSLRALKSLYDILSLISIMYYFYNIEVLYK